MDDFYASYSDFKGWGRPAPSVRYEEYDEILAVGGCARPSRILEIGFGSGQFLDWARAGGHQVSGIDILPEMMAAARKRGHVIYETLDDNIEGTFDLIVAIDVFEHIQRSDLVKMLTRCRRLLTSEGRIVARFPNGGSPFSALYQNGDATHLSAITVSALAQIALPTGMMIDRGVNSRALPSAFLAKIRRRAIYALRDLVEILIGRIYYGGRVPLDPNILVVMAPLPLFEPVGPGRADLSLLKNGRASPSAY